MIKGVSVIVPTRGHSPFLRDALSSVKQQSTRVAEIIVCDHIDSQDVVFNICRESEGIKFFQHDSLNANVSMQRNLGIKIAKGDYIAFLDSDDIWPKFRTEHLLEEIINSKVEAAFGYMSEFEGEIVLEETSILGLRPATLVSLGLFRKELLNRVGMFDSTLSMGETVEWWDRAVTLGVEFGLINECTLQRRIHNENLSNSSQEQFAKNYLEAIRIITKRKFDNPN